MSRELNALIAEPTIVGHAASGQWDRWDGDLLAPAAREYANPLREPGAGRILLVSNRLPVTAIPSDDEPTLTASQGGLARGLTHIHQLSNSLWIGWSGIERDLAATARRGLDRELARRRLVEVPLAREEVAVFYERIANGVLWPMFHDQLEQLPYLVDGWDVYETVNERFADVVAAVYRPGDVIWIHDYHLLPLPALLRARLPDARIGFFLHIPFPSPEIFLALPRRRWLLEGVLAADVVGFHTRRYLTNFVAAASHLLGVRRLVEGTLEYNGRCVDVGAFPMGIDAGAFATRASDRDVAAEVVRLRSERGVRLLVGVDRLDYSKGIPHRLLAVERLLIRHPEWRERLRLVQVAVPSRGAVDAYQRIRQTVEHLVGRINGQFGTPRWTPIRYVGQSISDVELSALYRAADALLVTPLRDGMNLVSKEFVASRTDGDGVLVLSEFAGAADELTEALLVNPYDVDGMATVIHDALSLPRGERRARMQALRDRVMTRDIVHWADDVLDSIRGTPQTG